MVDQCSRTMTNKTEIFTFLCLGGINEHSDPHIKCHSTGRTTCMDLRMRKVGERMNGFTVNIQWMYDGEACGHGNSGEESMSLTSNGTVADRRCRREGHHFSVEGVKQARDILA